MKKRRHKLHRRYGRTAGGAMTTAQVIAAAERHVPDAHMRSSAQLCVDDARALAAKGDTVHARQRAIKSLAYSVGILSPLYQAALKGGA